MSATLISVVTVIYVAVALREGFGGRPEMAVVWSGYAFANIGLIWATMR